MVPKSGDKIQHPNPFLVEKHFREYVLPHGWLKQARKRSGGTSGLISGVFLNYFYLEILISRIFSFQFFSPPLGNYRFQPNRKRFQNK